MIIVSSLAHPHTLATASQDGWSSLFDGRSLAGWTTDVLAYVAHRQNQGVERSKHVPTGTGEQTAPQVVRVGDVSNGELNRELARS